MDETREGPSSGTPGTNQGYPVVVISGETECAGAAARTGCLVDIQGYRPTVSVAW